MPQVQLSAFVTSLGGTKFQKEPVYIFYGSEPKRSEETAAKLKDILVKEVGEDNYFRYVKLGSDEDASLKDIVAQLNTISMFGGGGKIVWLGPLESIGKDDAKTLEAYINNPNPGSTLIVNITLSKGDNKALADFEKTSLLKTAVNKAVAVKFVAPKGAELTKWVQTKFKEKGVSIHPAALERLIELADRDLERLDGEAEKLISFIGDGKEITVDAVESTVSDARTDNIWDLTGAVARRDLAAALSALDSLLASNIAPQVLLKTLTGEVMRLASIRKLREDGVSAESAAQQLGAARFMVEKIWDAARKWPAGLAKKGLEAIFKANMDIMRAGVPPETALTGLLLVLCEKPKSR